MGAVRWIAKVVQIPRSVLLSVILVFCVVGSYAVNSSFADVWVMIAFGVIGLGLEAVNERMAKAIDDIPAFDAADAEFHAIIARAGGNAVIESYVTHLWSLRQSKLWETWYAKTRKTANRRRSVEDHRQIFRALKRGQPDMAQTAMRAHLDVLAERFLI